MVASNRDTNLEGFIETIEGEDREIQSHNEVKSAIYKAAKDAGYNVKVLRRIISERRLDPEKRREEYDIYEEYRAKLGMDE